MEVENIKYRRCALECSMRGCNERVFKSSLVSFSTVWWQPAYTKITRSRAVRSIMPTVRWSVWALGASHGNVSVAPHSYPMLTKEQGTQMVKSNSAVLLASIQMTVAWKDSPLHRLVIRISNENGDPSRMKLLKPTRRLKCESQHPPSPIQRD